MKTDEELLRTIQVSREGDLVHYVMLKVQPVEADSTRQAQLAEAAILKHFAATPNRKLDALVDLVPLGKARYLSNKAKKIYIGLMSLEQLNKMAFVVPSRFIQLMTGLFTQFSSSWGHVKWFTDEDKARAWLQSDQE